jgi:hypothetical protein
LALEFFTLTNAFVFGQECDCSSYVAFALPEPENRSKFFPSAKVVASGVPPDVEPRPAGSVLGIDNF